MLLSTLGRTVFGASRSLPSAPIPGGPLPLFGHEIKSFLQATLDIPVWANKMPQDADFPTLVFHVVSRTGGKTLRGADGIVAWRVQFDAYGLDPNSAAAVSEILRAAFEGYRGPMGSLNVRDVTLATTKTGFEADKPGSDEGTYRDMTEYVITVRAPAAAP